MGIWNSLRRFSGKKTLRERSTGRSPKQKTRRNRDLRLERFEDRVLLSISPTGAENLVWSNTLDRAIERASDLESYGAEALDAARATFVAQPDARAGIGERIARVAVGAPPRRAERRAARERWKLWLVVGRFRRHARCRR